MARTNSSCWSSQSVLLLSKEMANKWSAMGIVSMSDNPVPPARRSDRTGNRTPISGLKARLPDRWKMRP